jgi:gliding motility-associated-like protein
VRLTVSVQGGCTTTRTWLRQVRIGAYPQISVVPTRTRLYPDSAQVGFSVVGAPSGSTYAWTLGDGTQTTTPGLVHTYVPDTNYAVCVVVTSPEGCSDTACVDLWSAVRIALPNVVTPNNDNQNDWFVPEVVGHDWLSWEVRDRWGQRVFETETRGARWDGTSNGRPVPEGVYYVSVKAGNAGGLRGQAAGAVHVFR